MKNFIIPVLILLCFLAAIKNTSSQVQFFDSVKTVVSSSAYDYRNPVFSNNIGSFGNGFSWIAYERHNGSYSDIVIRKAQYSSYDSEIVITNTVNALNINPSLDQRMLVWQSNARGNWDIYYSVLTNEGNWSAPVILDSSDADVTNPYIRNNNNGPEQNNFTYLAYRKNNFIGLKRFKTINGIWDNDTIVTDGINEDITPVIMKGNYSNQLVIFFLRK